MWFDWQDNTNSNGKEGLFEFQHWLLNGGWTWKCLSDMFHTCSIPRKNRCGLSKCMEDGKQTSTNSRKQCIFQSEGDESCKNATNDYTNDHKCIAAEVPLSFCMFYVRSKQISNNLTYTAIFPTWLRTSQSWVFKFCIIPWTCERAWNDSDHFKWYLLFIATLHLGSPELCLEIDWWQVILLSSKYSDMCLMEAT